ncbi:MAG: glycosyltransferase [Deltaproteobacteria bacterium]|nr:glycosyltransferase [Deltaproteobacteria bacterium]
MSALVVFTQSFPFGEGESFFGAELPYLAREFDRVTLVPSTRASGSSKTLPKGVSVDIGLAEARPLPTWPTALLEASVWDVAELVRYSARALIKGSRRFARFVRAITRTERYFATRHDDLSTTLYYAYWFEGAATALGLMARRDRRLRAVTRAHGWDLYEERHDPRWFPFRRRALEGLAAVFPVSDHGARHLIDRYPEEASRIQVARLGVEPIERELGAPGAPSRAHGPFRVMSCSAVIPVKRVDRIAESLMLLATRHPARGFEWAHFGDGPLLTEVRAAISSAPVNLRTELRGRVSNEVVRSHLSTSRVDVFMSASESEGVPVSIMEAQAAGVPVVAPDVGGISEIVRRDSGFLVPAPARPEDLAERVARLVGSAELSEAFAAGARRSWAELSDVRVNASAFVRSLAGLARG